MFAGRVLDMNFTTENLSRNQEVNIAIGVENSLIDRDENLARVEIATLAIIFLVTVIGNSTVLLALWTRRRYAGRKKLSRMYFFILHLSIADLITAFLSVLPQLAWEVTYRFHGGYFMCKLVKYGQTLGPYLSSYILMATAVDRHQAICYPLTYCSWTSRRSKVMVYIAWVVSLVFCIPQVTIFSIQEVAAGITDCWATFEEDWGEQAYVIWYSISIFMIPLLVLVYTYTCICREIWQSSESSLRPRSSQRGGTNRRTPFISRAKINTVKQTIAVIVMYIICSTPFIVAQLWATIDPNNPFLDGPVFTILVLLYSLNSCVNPWIYLAFNRELPRLLLRHYTASTKNYRAAAGGIGLTVIRSSGNKQHLENLKYEPEYQPETNDKSEIYEISCKDYQKNYAEQTRRRILTKFKEHICHLKYERTGQSPSNSSGDVQTTSLRPFSRWSRYTSARFHKYPNHLSYRPHVAQYNSHRWIVTTTT